MYPTFRQPSRNLLVLLQLMLFGTSMSCSVGDLKPGLTDDVGMDGGSLDLQQAGQDSHSTYDAASPQRDATASDRPMEASGNPDSTTASEHPAQRDAGGVVTDGAADKPVGAGDAGADVIPTTPDLPAQASCTFWNGTPLTWAAVPDLPGTISALAANPSSGGWYASGTGVGMYRSTDRGVSFAPAATGLDSTSSFSGISVLTPCGADAMCTDVGNSVFKTTSTTWTKLAANMTNSSGGFSRMVAVPSDPNTLYATTYDGLMRSDDGGEGWITIGKGLPSGQPADVAVDPSRTDVVYVATGSMGFSGQGVFRSLDRGATFSAANRGMLDVAVTSLVVARDGTVYAASSSKIYRSFDGGGTWQGDAMASGSGTGSVARLVVNEALGGVLFVLFSNLEVKVSCDRGSSFQTLTSKPSLGTNSGFTPPPLLVDLHDTELAVMAGTAGSGAFRVTAQVVVPPPLDVDAGVQDSGSITPIDGGNVPASPCPFWRSLRVKSWQPVPDLPTAIGSLVRDPASSDIFAGTNGAGVFKSVDRGTSWAAAATGLPTFSGFGGLTALNLCGVSPTAICVGIGNSVYGTTNGGEGWTERAQDMTNSTGGFDILYALPTDPTILFGFAYTVFMSSSNGGAGWIDVGNTFPNEPSVMAASPNDPQVIYAGTGSGPYQGQGVYKSVDRGLTWTPANSGILDKSISALEVDHADKIWAVSGSTLYVSDDGGAHWTDVSATLPAAGRESIVRLVAGPAGVLFALRASLQTEVTCDGGATWHTLVAGKGGVSSGFSAPALLPVGDAASMVLLAGTEDDGGFRVAVE